MADNIISMPPAALDIQPDNIPKEFKEKKRWLLWRWESRGNGKYTKPPYQVNGEKAKVNAPETWGTYDEVYEVLKSSKIYHGIGFVFTDDDDFIGWDLDHCINTKTGELEPWAQHIVSELNSYTEVTPSGEGLRIFVTGKLPKRGSKKGNVECYQTLRFLTVTGNTYPGTPSEINENKLEVWEEAFLGKSRKKTDDDKQPKKERKRNQNDLLEEGEWKEAGYPSQSEADLAYCRYLADDARGSKERIDELFRKSKLFRDKWDKPHSGDGRTYGQITIDLAVQSWESQFRLTDLGNAKRFANLIRSEVRFCNGRWYIWDGKRLKEDDLQRIYILARRVIDELKEETKSIVDREERKKLWNHMLQLESKNRMESMIKLTESHEDIALRLEELDKNLLLFNTESGMLSAEGRLFNHDFEEYMTKISPVKVNQKATCPEWEKFLNKVLPDSDIRHFVQKFVGYSMTGLITEQVLAFLYGNGANGKSTFLHIISRVFGDYFAQLPVESLMATKNEQHSTVLTDLRGVRFVVASEPEDGRRFNEGLLKQLTGGERIKARRMHENFMDFESTAKLWIMGNHKPTIRGSDYAIWRRIRLIPFTVTIPKEEQDKELWTKLENELEGILMWCIKGLRLWQEEGLEPPKGVILATEEYRSEMDTVQDFLNEEIEPEPGNWQLHPVLYARYSQRASNNNERPLSSRALIQKLREKGYEDQRRTGNQLYWRDIKMVTRGPEQREM